MKHGEASFLIEVDAGHHTPTLRTNPSGLRFDLHLATFTFIGEISCDIPVVDIM